MAKVARTKAMANYSDKLAQFAKAAAETESSVSLGKFLSVRAGQLSYNGNAVPGNKLNVVVLDSIMENVYYGTEFDPDNPATPVCFAFGRSDAELAPHEKSTEPQHERCKGCPNNEFGTAERGKGKACKNTRRLSMLVEGALNEDIENAEALFLKLPVTSVKAWAGYVQQLATAHNKPPFCFVTEISTIPDAKTQFKVQFRMVEEVDGAHIPALIDRHEKAGDSLAVPYVAREDAGEAAKPAKPAKFKARR